MKENIGGIIIIVFFSSLFVWVFSYFFGVPWWACVLFLFLFLNLIILKGVDDELTNIKQFYLSDIKQDINKLKSKCKIY